MSEGFHRQRSIRKAQGLNENKLTECINRMKNTSQVYNTDKFLAAITWILQLCLKVFVSAVTSFFWPCEQSIMHLPDAISYLRKWCNFMPLSSLYWKNILLSFLTLLKNCMWIGKKKDPEDKCDKIIVKVLSKDKSGFLHNF